MTAVTKPRLKPCPKCGSGVVAVACGGLLWKGFCLSCLYAGEGRTTKREAIAAWNRRAKKERSE